MTCPRLLQPFKGEIHPYTNAYEEELLQLWLRSSIQGHPFIPVSFWEKELQTIRSYYLPKSETWLAIEENRLTGFISLLDKLIGGLFVLPEAMGRKVGSQLLSKAISVRPKALEVEVYEKNLRARRFYHQHGFVFQDSRLQAETNEVLLRMHHLSCF